MAGDADGRVCASCYQLNVSRPHLLAGVIDVDRGVRRCHGEEQHPTRLRLEEHRLRVEQEAVAPGHRLQERGDRRLHCVHDAFKSDPGGSRSLPPSARGRRASSAPYLQRHVVRAPCVCLDVVRAQLRGHVRHRLQIRADGVRKRWEVQLVRTRDLDKANSGLISCQRRHLRAEEVVDKFCELVRRHVVLQQAWHVLEHSVAECESRVASARGALGFELRSTLDQLLAHAHRRARAVSCRILGASCRIPHALLLALHRQCAGEVLAIHAWLASLLWLLWERGGAARAACRIRVGAVESRALTRAAACCDEHRGY